MVSKDGCYVRLLKNNVAIIYAPNGTMKSSLAKTFESIRDNLYEQVKTKLKYSPRSSFETKIVC